MPERIKVELEFIPIEERLPEKSGLYFVLYKGVYRVMEGSCSVVFHEWSKSEHRRPSHWAEIPKVESPVEANKGGKTCPE